MRRGLAILLALVSSMSAAAQDPDVITVNPNRPTFATPAKTTQVGVLELEAGLQRSLYRYGSRSDFEPLLLKLGQSARFEWRLGWNGFLAQTAPDGSHTQGFADPALGFQWHPLDQDQLGFDGSLGYSHKFATANAVEGLGSGRADDTLTLLASKDLGPLHVDMNLLEGWIGQATGARATQTSGVVSVSWPVAGAWGMGAEIYGVGGTRSAARDAAFLSFVSYQPSSRCVLDAGFDHGLTNGAPRWNLFLGVTYGLDRLFHPEIPR